MEDSIKEVLANGPLLSKQIAEKLGKRKVKDIQKHLNNLVKNNIIKKRKSNTCIEYSLVLLPSINGNVLNNDLNVETTEHVKNKSDDKVHVTEKSSVEAYNAPSYDELLIGIVESFKEEILYLREQLKCKDELLSSQQKTIHMLISKKEKKVEVPKKVRWGDTTNSDTSSSGEDDESVVISNENERFYHKENSSKDAKKRSILREDEASNSEENRRFEGRTTNPNKSTKRPSIIHARLPEKNHFTNNLKNKNNRPLIALLGDSTIKNISGFQLGKYCKGTAVMVRSQQGGKVKNIKNLMIDLLDDGVKPQALCYHVGTNDISAGRNVDDV